MATPEQVANATAWAEASVEQLRKARDELQRTAMLANAGSAVLMVLVPGIGLVSYAAHSESRVAVDAVIAAINDSLSGSIPRLVERIRNGELDRVEPLRRLLANLLQVIRDTVPDATFANTGPMRFLDEVVQQSAQDVVDKGAALLPTVGFGFGAALGAFGIYWVWDNFFRK